MKPSSPLFSACLAFVATAVFTLTAFSQAPAPQQPPAEDAEHHHHEEPAPTNLKVLPKTMTGEQVHELMHKWEASLGAECSTCHAADPNRKTPSGKPALNFADDSKPEKNTARLMYRMVEDINNNYVDKVENSGVPVTCGTCHRGHLDPPIFTPPKEERDHDHAAPPVGTEKPPAGTR